MFSGEIALRNNHYYYYYFSLAYVKVNKADSLLPSGCNGPLVNKKYKVF